LAGKQKTAFGYSKFHLSNFQVNKRVLYCTSRLGDSFWYFSISIYCSQPNF